MLKIWHNLLEWAWPRMVASFDGRKLTKLLQLGRNLIPGPSTSESENFTMDTSDFSKLTSKSVPHILERIFLSLDYETFKSCMEVSTVWRNVLRSEHFQSRAKSKYDDKIERELMKASSTGDLKRVKSILSKFMVDIDSIGKNHCTTSLMQASMGGSKDVVNLLLNKGANPNKETTLLCQASFGGHKDVVNFLLNEGANPNKRAPLRWATMAGHVHVVKLLLERGSNPNIRNYYGATPLHSVAYRGDEDMVQLLVEHGSDPNLKDEGGCSPLFYAALHGHMRVVMFLIDKGASLTISTTAGWAVLHGAAWFGHTDIVTLLLNQGADPKAQTHKGENALFLASHRGYGDVVKILAPLT